MDSASRFVRAATDLPDAEQGWLGALLEICSSGPVALSEAWRRAWFTPRAGCAVILQPESGAAYLYVGPAQSSDAGRIQADLVSAALLLDDMVNCGIATTYDATQAPTGVLRCIGGGFDTPRVVMEHGAPRLVLDPEGDYTEDPSAIRNARGEVVYDGLPLGTELSALLLRYTCGVLAIRPTLHATLLRSRIAPPRVADRSAPADAAIVSADAVPPASTGERGASPRTALHDAGLAADDLATLPLRPRPPARTRTRRRPRWVAILVACKLSVAFGVAIGVYVDDFSDVLDLSRQAQVAMPPRRAVSPTPPPTVPASTAAANMPQVWPQPSIDDRDVDPPPADASVAMQAAEATALVGTDISQWSGNGVRGAAAVFDAVPDLHFAFARVAYGRRLDHEFHTNWRLMGERGIYRGGYLFLRLDEDPIAQVDNAVEALGPATANDLCLTIDFEEQSFHPRQPAPARHDVRRIVLAALDRARDRLGCMPLLYTNWNMGSTYLDDPRFTPYPLWIADWTEAAAPRLPPAWTTFAFWQRSDRLPASPSPADLDVFAGTPVELGRLVRD